MIFFYLKVCRSGIIIDCFAANLKSTEQNKNIWSAQTFILKYCLQEIISLQSLLLNFKNKFYTNPLSVFSLSKSIFFVLFSSSINLLRSKYTSSLTRLLIFVIHLIVILLEHLVKGKKRAFISTLYWYNFCI